MGLPGEAQARVVIRTKIDQIERDRIRAFRVHVDDDAARRRFEDDIRIFLAEQRIYGAGQGQDQLEIGDETRLLIAASAAILCHGMPSFEWPRMRDIVVHPRAFDENYGNEDPTIAGMVHLQGPILYSERDLRLGFRRHDGHNVGLHELAHTRLQEIERADEKATKVRAAIRAMDRPSMLQRLSEIFSVRPNSVLAFRNFERLSDDDLRSALEDAESMIERMV